MNPIFSVIATVLASQRNPQNVRIKKKVIQCAWIENIFIHKFIKNNTDPMLRCHYASEFEEGSLELCLKLHHLDNNIKADKNVG